MRSSQLDRAVSTARSFLDAVFPPAPERVTPTAYLPDGQQARVGSSSGLPHGLRGGRLCA